MPKELIENRILAAQRSEITEYFIYKKLAGATKDTGNKELLGHISEDELRHYHLWREETKKDISPDKQKVWWYSFLSKIFGITFGVKLMEVGEGKAQINYEELAEFAKRAKEIEEDEKNHERQLISLIKEERLEYVGSMILGLHDALIEMTGVLAGLTLALHNARLIVLTGLITGIAASLSMAASEYLSNKTEESSKSPVIAALYTGFIYLFAVAFLLFPYLLFKNIYFSLGLTVFNAFLLTLVFTFYISVAKDIDFKKRLLEMTAITFGVAALTFAIGFLVRIYLGVNV
jgi:vacuolar iron transporter family protein